ncbi:MAG: flavin reductase family protein [Rhodospirillales bacterium]|nr:flavin reductase family protein [Rhodospirillales bacterium]
MFYDCAKNDHGLKHDPFKACIVPRPIGWISTISKDGVVNLAPFSFFNAVSESPPMVMFATNGSHRHGGLKDSLQNAIDTREFVVNLATWDLREAMNATSAGVESTVDEAAVAGLAMAPSRLVKPPRVAASPVHLECALHDVVELPPARYGPNHLVIGRVLGVHIEDGVLVEGRLDLSRVRPIARLGYHDYTVVGEIFTMMRPA